MLYHRYREYQTELEDPVEEAKRQCDALMMMIMMIIMMMMMNDDDDDDDVF